MTYTDIKDLTVEELEKDGAILGADFVTTASGKGVVGDLPEWLMLELGPEDSQNPEQQATDIKLGKAIIKKIDNLDMIICFFVFL